MHSDDLVRSLVADLTPVRRLRSLDSRLALWVGLAVLCVAAGAYGLGARPDLARKLHDPSYLGESAALLLLAVSSARRALHLSIPGAEPSRLARAVPLIELCAWVFLVAIRWSAGTSTQLPGAALWSGGWKCAARILGLALLPSIPLFLMLRRAVPRERAWIGWFAVLATSALATLGTQVVCAKDDPGHVLRWHVVPVVIAALAGVGAGRWLLSADRPSLAARDRERSASVAR